MPFKSERQRKWMHANMPKMAMELEHEGKRMAKKKTKKKPKKGY